MNEKNKKHNIPKPVVLMILDGWGINQAYPGNAITSAKTPFIDSLIQEYPATTIRASGESVGTEESYAFNIDGITITKIYAESNGSGGIQNSKLQVLKTLQADSSVYLKGIASGSQTNALYYNSTTGEVTYATASSGGGSGDVGWNSGNVGSNNQITTAVGDGSINAEPNLTFNGSELDVTGDVSISGNNIVNSYQYMGDPNTDGSWRFYVNGDGDLVFEKRVSGTWTEGGKFTI